MDLLESPLEPLAFRYSDAFAGSAWAWLAVLFAALGLWRIRAVGSSKSDPLPEPPEKPVGPTQSSQLPLSALASAPVAWSPVCHVDGGDSTPKGRFTAYFHVKDNGHEVEDEEGDGVSDVDWKEEEEEEEQWPLGGWKWEGMELKRLGDLRWYRYQDLTALNGSVVRLWNGDGGLRRRL